MMRPGVGVGVIIEKDGQVLLGLRKNALGADTWAFPGGHLEFQETWAECARREVWEETGLVITNIRFFTATNDIFFNEQIHFVTIFMMADYSAGKATVREPDKCEQWQWFDKNALPSPLFQTLQTMIAQQPDQFSHGSRPVLRLKALEGRRTLRSVLLTTNRKNSSRRILGNILLAI